MPDCNDVSNHKEGFTPHLSVGQFYGKKILKQKINEFQNSWISLKFELKEIHFICRENNKDSKFRIEYYIPLKISKT